jgi:hypothetical protein
MRVLSMVLACALLGAPAALAAEPKVIKDVAEYNAYMAALKTADPAAKAAAMDGFTHSYPKSVVLTDALEQEMAAWQAAGDAGKVEATARRLVDLQPDSVRALAILTFLGRTRATAGDAAAVDATGALAQRGKAAWATWTKPDEVTDAEFASLKRQTGSIFSGAIGFQALSHKDYPKARTAYEAALALDPDNMQNAYQLSIAELESSPPDPTGFWWAGRAAAMASANPAGHNAIVAYAKAKYRHFHGGEDGWEALMASAAAGGPPPPGFTVKPAPTPAEIAVQALRDNKVADLSLSDWEFILSQAGASPANQAAADQVWAHIQDLQKQGAARMKLTVKVLALGAGGLQVAATDDARSSGRPDLQVMLKPGASLPAAGSEIAVTGVLVRYQPQPFLFTMEQGEIGPK